MWTRLALGLLALSCAPAPPPPTPPAAPVLEGSATPAVSLVPQWTLAGSAQEGTVVRLHLDDTCVGPVLRDVTAQQLAQGVALELVAGTVNTFTAVAIDGQGLVSSCSAPVRMLYQRPVPPQRPTVRSTPASPSRETHFQLTGSAISAASVALFAGGACAGTPLARLSVEEFSLPGFPVDLAENGFAAFSVAAFNLIDERSGCSPSLTLINDRQPPLIEARLRSPAPSPELQAFVSITQEHGDALVFQGPGCGGPVLARCTNRACNAVLVEFPPNPIQPWSVEATDPLGNRSPCVDSLEPWRFEPDAGVPAIVLEAGELVKGLVPVSSTIALLFEGPDCDPAWERGWFAGVQLAGSGIFGLGLFGELDGGVVTARGADGGTLFPCSQPVPRQ